MIRRMLAAAVLAAAILSGCDAVAIRPVPMCEEDSVLIGTGDFESGRWSAYMCGPAVDDYAERIDQ